MPHPILSNALTVAPDYDALCDEVAERIAQLVQAKPHAVLGLATGATPLGVYQRLIQRHRQHALDFHRVTCFNLDEYYPMTPDSPHSYHHFMQENLFRHIHGLRGFVPDGTPRPDDQISHSCRDYEARIADAGGIDLQLLGIGRSGHIGFNEPGSAPGSRTRRVRLHAQTREDAAGSFGGLGNVPWEAVSVGIGTILEAREIVLMASGGSKAEVVRAAWSGPVSDRVPASWVRTHPNARLCLDESAAALLGK